MVQVTQDAEAHPKKIKIGGDRDGGSDGGDAAAVSCAADTLPAAERSTIYQQARANLEASGTTFDASWWSDETKFEVFVKEVYSVAGCSLPTDSPGANQDGGTATIKQPLHSDEGPDFYCGPGHGLAKLWTPHVSACMNELCRKHDACYAMCSAKTDFPCMWNDNTSSCDSPFLQQVAACPPEPGTQLMSGAVEFIANALDVVGSVLTCGNMTCPILGEVGIGVCSTDRTGSDCDACLGETDRGSRCFERACVDAPVDPICYAANCPMVAECYGGYGKGLPGAVIPTAPVLDPDVVLWTLVAEEGDLPATKPDGTPWDVDLLGFSPPDPYVRVTVGTDVGVTTSPEDVPFATWNESVLKSQPAAALREGITFDVWDEDLTIDDHVGSCSFQMSNDDFNPKSLAATCDTVGLEVYFHVQAEP